MSKWIIFLFLGITLYFVEQRPKIVCRIPCTQCSKGYVEHDMTKEAVALKGRSAFIKTHEGKIIRFNNCFGLKKDFFKRTYTYRGDLFWESIFGKLDTFK